MRTSPSAPPGADGLVLVPYLEGERTPNKPDATGAIHGMRLANTTPEVPIEIATSPALMPRPRAAAALSPAPGPRRRPPASEAVSHGPRTRGRPTSRPKPIASRSGRYDSENGDQ